MQPALDSHSLFGTDKSGNRRTLEHFTGCLLGDAVGDALGAPVEFDSIQAIRSQYGSAGITDYDAAYGRRGAITDDTQMRSSQRKGCYAPSRGGVTKASVILRLRFITLISVGCARKASGAGRISRKTRWTAG